jgi:hypothetical protein
MTEMLRIREPPIDPVFSQEAPNEPIEFGQVQLQFNYRGNVYEDTAIARLIFEPEDELRFICSLDGQPSDVAFGLMTDGAEIKFTLKDRGVDFDAIVIRSGEKHGGIVFSPTRSAVVVTPPSTSLTYCVFHVFNFPRFSAGQNYVLVTGEPPRQGGEVCGRAVLENDDWQVSITATAETKPLLEELEIQGGYVLTHVGRVARRDNVSFSSDELDRILSGIHYFVSFALGRWAGIALPVGFNSGGERCHEEWGTRMTANGPWDGGTSWFDVRHGDLLGQVFPGFMALWTSDLWKDPLSHAIYWYLGACDRRVGIGVDSGLILAQTALELLAWTYCVRDSKMVSPDTFGKRGLPAARKLRLLLSSLGIPLEIPSGLAALQAKPGLIERIWSHFVAPKGTSLTLKGVPEGAVIEVKIDTRNAREPVPPSPVLIVQTGDKPPTPAIQTALPSTGGSEPKRLS